MAVVAVAGKFLTQLYRNIDDTISHFVFVLLFRLLLAAVIATVAVAAEVLAVAEARRVTRRSGSL